MEKENIWERILNTGLGIATAKLTPQQRAAQSAPAPAPAPAPGMSQKTLLLIGGAIVAVLALVFVLKK